MVGVNGTTFVPRGALVTAIQQHAAAATSGDSWLLRQQFVAVPTNYHVHAFSGTAVDVALPLFGTF